MKGLKIRPINVQDYEAVCLLYSEGDEYHRRGLPQVFRKATPSRSWEYFNGFLDGESGQMWLAEVEGQAAGLAAFKVMNPPEMPFKYPETWVYIDSLVVLEAYRGQGIGRALMEAVERWAREQGITKFDLHVHEFNQEAISFYEKLGYKTTMRRMRKEEE